MVHVEITNFQSIKSLSFDFEGFTTIVGRNFIGKSAALRAINAALTNQQGTDFIRWGERFCEVLIKTNDIKILWHKEDNNNFYKINDTEEHEKIGNQPVPKSMVKAGFGLVPVGKEKMNLLYARQFFPLFLIDKMDAKSADLLISIYGLDKLYKAIDLCSKDQRKNTDLLKLRKIDLEQAEKDLEKFKGFEVLKGTVVELDSKKANLKKEKELIDKMTSWLERLVACTKEIKKLRPARDLSIPSYDIAEAAIVGHQKVIGYFQKVNSVKKDILRLRETKSVTIPEEATAGLDKRFKEIDVFKSLQKKHENLVSQINKIKRVKDIKMPEVPKNDSSELESLKEKYAKMAALVVDVKSLRVSLDSTKNILGITSVELNKYRNCPTCGAELKNND